MSAPPLRVLQVGADAPAGPPFPGLRDESGGPCIALERAPSLDEGLRRLSDEPFDLLLLDLTVGGAKGLDALARARRSAPDVAIVVLADGADEEVALRALAAGAQDCIGRAELHGPALARVLRRAVVRKRVERDLSAAKEAAERASLSKSDFLARLSHELRTPLTSVIGFSEMMASQAFGPLGDPRYLQYARDIAASGSFILDLVNDILDFAKVESGQLRLQEREIDVAATAEDCVRLIQPRARERTLTVVARIPEGLPRLRADERMVRQILLNLLSNTVKFTLPEGRVTVSARLVPAEDGRGRSLALSVSDTGVGIAPHDIDRVVSPFAQADNPAMGPERGTGLGLAVVARLMELHGGTLELESEVGVGTTATVRFPPQRTVAGPHGALP